ncbi:MAG: aldo/keto reductase [Pedosphaera parvula]|nr:aldo/keto reductase [Pedosphaera parvula]
MRTITLGESSLSCSRLAYGCWRIVGTQEPKEVTGERVAVGEAAILAAVEAGYTLFDLADVYCNGVCEAIFGQTLNERPGLRDKLLIATKCGIRRPGEPDHESRYRYDFSAEHIVGSVEQALGRLALETIDLLMLHRPDWLCEPEEVARAFSQLKKDGKVREFGVSNFRPSQVTLLQKACPMKLVVNQVEISLARLDGFSDGTVDQCMTEKITPMSWSPLAAGRLASGAPISMQDPQHVRWQKMRDVLDVIARNHAVSRTVIALAWLLKHPSGIVPIVGSINPERIQDAALAAEFELSREEWYRLLEAAYGQRLP